MKSKNRKLKKFLFKEIRDSLDSTYNLQGYFRKETDVSVYRAFMHLYPSKLSDDLLEIMEAIHDQAES